MIAHWGNDVQYNKNCVIYKYLIIIVLNNIHIYDIIQKIFIIKRSINDTNIKLYPRIQ